MAGDVTFMDALIAFPLGYFWFGFPLYLLVRFIHPAFKFPAMATTLLCAGGGYSIWVTSHGFVSLSGPLTASVWGLFIIWIISLFVGVWQGLGPSKRSPENLKTVETITSKPEGS